eukprot:502298-Prymnesium_polylepis.1
MRQDDDTSRQPRNTRNSANRVHTDKHSSPAPVVMLLRTYPRTHACAMDNNLRRWNVQAHDTTGASPFAHHTGHCTSVCAPQVGLGAAVSAPNVNLTGGRLGTVAGAG